MTTRGFLVTGRVQGVGFRYFVSRLATQFGVRGEVWNERDGSVQGAVQQEDAQRVQAFLIALKTGPGRVEDVHVHDPKTEIRYESFQIISGTRMA